MERKLLNTLQAILLCAFLGAIFWAVVIGLVIKLASADHEMCSMWPSNKTVTVWAYPGMNPAVNNGLSYSDVQAAVNAWNTASRQAIGRDVFRLVGGNWYDADVLVHAGSEVTQTWTNTVCAPGYRQNGNNRAVVFMGYYSRYFARTALTHELGHALGFADHLEPGASTAGYINPKVGGSYAGIMRYSTLSYGLTSWSNDYAMLRRWFR